MTFNSSTERTLGSSVGTVQKRFDIEHSTLPIHHAFSNCTQRDAVTDQNIFEVRKSLLAEMTTSDTAAATGKKLLPQRSRGRIERCCGLAHKSLLN